MRGDTPPLIDLGVDLPPHPFGQAQPYTSAARKSQMPGRDGQPLLGQEEDAAKETAELITRLILAHQPRLAGIDTKLQQVGIELDRVKSELVLAKSERDQAEIERDRLEGIIQWLVALLPDGLPGPNGDAVAKIRFGNRDLPLPLLADAQQSATMTTSAIDNAKDREPSPSSSGPSKPSATTSSMTSSNPSSALKPPESALPQGSSAVESTSLESPQQAPPRRPAGPREAQWGRKSVIFMPPPTSTQPSAASAVSGPTKKARGRPRIPSSSASTAQPVLAPIESMTSPDNTPNSSAELSDASDNIRRSARSYTRPDNYFGFADPKHPSYLGPIVHASSARTRKQRATLIKANEAAITLGRSDGVIRALGAAWPEMPMKTPEGISIEVVCDVCTARCHLACAGLSLDEYSFHDWICPDCMHIASTGRAPEEVDASAHGKCIRHDCILIPKRKRSYETADELEYTLERIIGRRRAPDWNMANRRFEYLLLWKGIDRSTGRSWGIEDATWEPKANVFEIHKEEPRFTEACLAEGFDPRTDVPRPILLKEAESAWTEEGELKVDGWSKRIMAKLAEGRESSRKKKSSDKVESVSVSAPTSD